MEGAPLWVMPVADIDRAAVLESLDPMRAHLVDGKPWPAWGPKSLSPGTLHKLYTYLRGAYQFAAVDLKLAVVENPFVQWRALVKWPQPTRRTTYLPTKARRPELGEGLG